MALQQFLPSVICSVDTGLGSAYSGNVCSVDRDSTRRYLQESHSEDEPMTWQRLKSNWKTVLSLAAVLACSTLLCLRWVYRVPIFQSPDEPTHFNYALCINEHRGLLKAPKDPEDGVTHPYVHLLLEEASTMTMVHTAMRVPLDYGTDAYYREID